MNSAYPSMRVRALPAAGWVLLCLALPTVGQQRILNLFSVSNPTTSPVYEGVADVHLATITFTETGNGLSAKLTSLTLAAVDGGTISERTNLSNIRAVYDTDNTPSTADTRYNAAGATLFSSNTDGTITLTETLTRPGNPFYMHVFCDVGGSIEEDGYLKLGVSYTATDEGTGDPTTNSSGISFVRSRCNLTSVANGIVNAATTQSDVYLGTATFNQTGTGAGPTLQSITVYAIDNPAVSEQTGLASVRALYDTDNTPAVTDAAYGASGTFDNNTNGKITFTQNLTVAATRYVHFYCNSAAVEDGGNLKLRVTFASNFEGTGDPTTQTVGTGFGANRCNLTAVANGTANAYSGGTDIYLGTATFMPSGGAVAPSLTSVTILAVDGATISENTRLGNVRAFYDSDNTPSTSDAAYGLATTFDNDVDGTAAFTQSVALAATRYVHFYCDAGQTIESDGNLRLQVSFTSDAEGTGDPTTNSTGTTFQRVAVWTNNGGAGDNNWDADANWSGGVKPGTADSVVFSPSYNFGCNLNASPTIRSIRFLGGYTGTFNFGAGSYALTIARNANFAGGETVTAGNGNLTFNASSGTQTLVPKTGATLPSITKSNAGTVLVSTYSLTAGALAVNAGKWDFGDEGQTHRVASITTAGGEIDFGTSTVQVTSGSANLSGLVTLTEGTGTLEFTAGSGTQILTSAGGAITHPTIRHTGAGRLQFAGASPILMLGFYNSAGGIDFNARNLTITTGNFTITNGTTSTVYDPSGTNSLGGITITVNNGNASLDGQSGNLLNLAASSWWYLVVVSGNLTANYADLDYSDATGSAFDGILSNGTAGANLVRWQTASVWTGAGGDNLWNTPGNWTNGVPGAGGSAKFESGAVQCDLNVAPTLLTLMFTSGYSGVFNFNGNNMSVSGDIDLRSSGSFIGTGTISLNGTTSQTIYPPSTSISASFSHPATSIVTISGNPLTTTGSISKSSSGTWDWGDAGLSHSVGSVATSGAAGEMDFGNSTVRVTSGSADFSALTTATPGTGTLEFNAAAGVQIFTAAAATQTHPHLRHTGAGRVQFAGASPVKVLSFYNSAGQIDFNSRDITTTTGDFTITAGTTTTIFNAAGTNSLVGRTIVVAGNATLSGTAGSYLNLNPGTPGWTMTVPAANNLIASYATIAWSTATNCCGYAAPATNGGNNNANWKFAFVWTGKPGAGGNVWSSSAAWTPAGPPGSSDVASFDGTATRECVLDGNCAVARIIFSSAYVQTFSFASYTLSVSNTATFTSGGDIIKGTGKLSLTAGGNPFLIPPVNDTLPSVEMNGTGTVAVSTYGLRSDMLTLNSGTFDFGDESCVHYLGSLKLNSVTANVDFGNSTVKVTGNTDLSVIGTVTTGTGTLELPGTSPQTLTPNTSKVYPAIVHSGSATLLLANNLSAVSFVQNAGVLNFGGYTVTTSGNFSITNGVSTSISGLGGVTITTTDGDVTLSGTAGDSLELTGSAWNVNVPATKSISATYAKIQNSTAVTATGVATLSRNLGSNVNWTFSTEPQPTANWNRSDLTNVKGAAIGDTKLFVGGGNTLYALLLSNGTNSWSYNSGYGTCTMPSYTYASGDYRVVVCQGNYLIRRDDAGGLQWSVDLGATPGTPYVSVDDASVYVLLGNNKLTKRTMASGARDATFGGGADVTVSNASTASDIVVFSGYVLVGSTNGVVTRYDAGDGSVHSSFTTGSGASINFPLVAGGGVLYIAPATNKLYTRDATNLNTQVWASPVTLGGTNTGAPFADGSKIYVAAGSKVQCVTNAGASGSVTWTYDAGATVQSGPIPYGGYVYFGRNSGRYYCINATTQADATDWPFKSASGNATAGPWIDIVSGTSQVIFGTDAGDMHSFNAQ